MPLEEFLLFGDSQGWNNEERKCPHCGATLVLENFGADSSPHWVEVCPDYDIEHEEASMRRALDVDGDGTGSEAEEGEDVHEHEHKQRAD